jgi:hypothetical protein
MLIAVNAAAKRDPGRYAGLSRRALAKTHLVMSGSYLHTRRLLPTVTHLAQAVVRDPNLAIYALGIAKRRAQRVGPRPPMQPDTPRSTS